MQFKGQLVSQYYVLSLSSYGLIRITLNFNFISYHSISLEFYVRRQEWTIKNGVSLTLRYLSIRLAPLDRMFRSVELLKETISKVIKFSIDLGGIGFKSLGNRYIMLVFMTEISRGIRAGSTNNVNLGEVNHFVTQAFVSKYEITIKIKERPGLNCW